MLLQGFIFFLIIAIIESKVVQRHLSKNKKYKETLKVKADETDIDSDVADAIKRINDNDVCSLADENPIILKHLVKYYGDLLAVRGLSIAIPKGECFGLLGVNGAGKTTTFKMLTGEEFISSGDAWIENKSVATELKQVSCIQLPDNFKIITHAWQDMIQHRKITMIITKLNYDFYHANHYELLNNGYDNS